MTSITERIQYRALMIIIREIEETGSSRTCGGASVIIERGKRYGYDLESNGTHISFRPIPEMKECGQLTMF